MEDQLHDVFESELAKSVKPLVELMAPQSGEKVLDIGCFTGNLSKILVGMGCSVLGIDNDPDAVAAACAAGLNAVVSDVYEFKPEEKFDAAISYSALNYAKDQYALVRRVWDLLKPGGRFAGESDGEGSIRIIREGIKIALIKRGIDYRARNPWKYLELGLFTRILENQGFNVKFMARIDKPLPPMVGDDALRKAIDLWAPSFTEGFTESERDEFYKEVEDYCRPMLYKEGLGWVADYVCVRFLAVKPEE